ncbi:hypothetical protein [Gluconobacter oxydans]|uniref:hypothetical protein n=1 Tax=Gluconobacter oxydans TaxID=442 RepID=UPI00062C8401|nr:hypothetical protein [Gluconobacter oxydans]
MPDAPEPKKISASEFEKKVFEREEVKIVLRVPADQQVNDYPYARKVADNTTVTGWLEGRLTETLGSDIDVEIVDGKSTRPHGRTKMETLRATYES